MLTKTPKINNSLSVRDNIQWITLEIIPSQLQSDALVKLQEFYAPWILKIEKVKIFQKYIFNLF
jgi:hypothetical protein